MAHSNKRRAKRTKIPPAYREGEKEELDRHWRTFFLDRLAETSNVKAAAKFAGINPARAYRVRREEEEFASAWRAALFEGYANLEMELLGYLRDPAPERKMDVGAALRLLTAHKETIVRERAQRANVSAAEVRAAIERKVDELRKTVAGREITRK